jgi:hypothetical protein
MNVLIKEGKGVLLTPTGLVSRPRLLGTPQVQSSRETNGKKSLQRT